MTGLITTRREDALFFVGLNRPEKRNAIHRDLLLELVDVIAAAEAERDVRAIILYGEGPVFSAGVDVAMLRGDIAGETPPRPFRALVGDMQAALSRLEAVEKPRRPTASSVSPRCGSGSSPTWAERRGWCARSATRGRRSFS